MFGAQVAPLSAEYHAPTRRPAAVAPFVSFQPRKILPAELIAMVGSTWSVYRDEPSVIFMVWQKDCEEVVATAARQDGVVGRLLVDPNGPPGAVTTGGRSPCLALVGTPTLRCCPAGLEATGIAAGERRPPSRSWGTGQARK